MSCQDTYSHLNSAQINEVQRTLCLLENDFEKEADREIDLSVILSTSNNENIPYEVNFEPIPNYITKINKTSEWFHVQVGSPQFYYVDLSNADGYVRVKIISNETGIY